MSQLEHYKELYQKGQFKEAIEGCQSLLATEKNNDDLHFCLALALAKTNELDQALEHTNAALGLEPHAERYLQFKGQLLMGLGKWDQAIKAFNASIQENPNLFYSYLALGDIYTIQQKPEKAKKQFELALKVHESALPAIIKMARLDVIKGDYEHAFQTLQEAELQYPHDASLKIQLGMVKLEMGEPGLAEVYFRTVLQTEADHLVAQAMLAMCLVAVDQQQAAQLITGLINENAKVPEVMVAMGMIYHHTNRHKQALVFLEPAARSGLALPSWVMAYAKSLAMTGEQEAAIEVLKKQLEQGNNPMVLMLLGQIFQQHGDFNKAAYTFKGIKNTSSLYPQAQMKLAEALYQKGAYDDALKVSGLIIKKDPNHPAALKLSINGMAKLNRFEQALQLMDGIDADKQTDDFNHLMSFYRGLLSDALGQYPNAWDAFKQVNRPEPASLELLNDEQEKMIASWPQESAESDIVLLFSDAATGQHEFVNWLLNNNHSVLLDRYSDQPRGDVFDNIKTLDELSVLGETQIHLLRKKYLTRTRTMVKHDSKKTIDCLPFTMAHAAIAKKVFPGLKVVVLTRNFADFRLHHHVFGVDQVPFSQFTSALNQMIAMGLDLTVVDVDEWMAGDEGAMAALQSVLGDDINAYQHKTRSPLEQFMLPHMHWKNYKDMMN